MGDLKELDKNTRELVGKSLSFEELREDLNGTSPLQMSKKLIEYELYDQKDSLEILDRIHQDFDNGGAVIDSLVTPVFLNIADGVVKHPKLGLAKSGVTATRLVSEMQSFSYDKPHKMRRDSVVDKSNLDENTKNNTIDRPYDRSKYEDQKRMHEYKKNYLDKRSRDEYTNQNNVKDKSPQPDHILSLKQATKELGTSKYLTDIDLKETLNEDYNLAVTNASLNQSKGEKSNTQAATEKKDTITANQNEKTKATMIKKEREAKKAVESELNKKAGKNLINDVKGRTQDKSKLINDAKNQALNDGKHKAIGEMFILIIKPIYFEFTDIFKNGIKHNCETNDNVEAFIFRFKRVKKYVIENAADTSLDNLKELVQSFVTMIVNGIVNAFVGLLKKALKVISEGFTAAVEAIKILMQPAEQSSAAQKADAITKILATTVVTFLGAYFEETVMGFLNGTPFDFLKDILMIILTGIASTVVVWMLDRVDIFSVNDERRLARVNEVFSLRIDTIKQNTDIFEKEAIEVLAKQKLQFKKLVGNMNDSIENNLNVNDSIYQMADFMQIDLHVKNTDDFFLMLQNNSKLTI